MKKALTIIIFILFTGFSFSIFSQIKKANKTKPQKTSKKTTKNQKPKLISLGVVNGRALNLVVPEFPRSAVLINLRGTVQVEIVIDEDGYVMEAKVLRGHPLLRNICSEAAKNSKFTPYFLDEKPRKVTGIIAYIFLPKNLNWLEIGYYSTETDKIKNFLPKDFTEEKSLIEKMNSPETSYHPDNYKNLIFSIENKLRTDEKNHWLFKLGMTLRNLMDNQWDNESKINALTEIQTLIYIKSPDASPNLNIKLEKLINLNQKNSDLFNKELLSILDNSFIYGK